MLVYQKTMFDGYYCIKSFRPLKTGKTLQKVQFCITLNGVKKNEVLIGTIKRFFTPMPMVEGYCFGTVFRTCS